MATAWNSNIYTVRPPIRKEDDPNPSGGDLGIFLMPPHQKNRMNHHHHQQQQRKLNLLQNCDLPPPSKIFSPTDKIMMSDSMNKALFRDYPPPVKEEEDELELLRAVRLSQTRAREAEMKRVEMEKEKERLANAFEVEAMRIFGYKQILKILEVEIGVLKGEKEGQWTGDEIVEEGKGDDGGGSKSGFSWAVVVALCMGAVGVGFAVGCRYV